MPKLKPRIEFGWEGNTCFLKTNYPPSAEEMNAVESCLSFIKKVVERNFPYKELNFSVQAAPLEGDVYWYLPAAPLTSFSVTVNWEEFLLSLRRMVDRQESFHDFITDNACISTESAIKEFFKKALEVES